MLRQLYCRFPKPSRHFLPPCRFGGMINRMMKHGGDRKIVGETLSQLGTDSPLSEKMGAYLLTRAGNQALVFSRPEQGGTSYDCISIFMLSLYNVMYIITVFKLSPFIFLVAMQRHRLETKCDREISLWSGERGRFNSIPPLFKFLCNTFACIFCPLSTFNYNNYYYWFVENACNEIVRNCEVCTVECHLSGCQLSEHVGYLTVGSVK